MLNAPAVVPVESAGNSRLTLAAIGIVACVLADMVHEALGHGTASLLTGDRIVSLSTVAIQNATGNRFVSAAGTLANCLVGVLALFLLRRIRGRTAEFTASTYFLWIFAAFNLLNSGYLVVSAALNNGDWANVIAGLSPPWMWRCMIGLAGAVLYVLSVRAISGFMVRLVESGQASVPDMQCLVFPAYLAGGAVMTIASIFNPISPSLILLSGAGASFGLNSGLLFVPGIVARNVRSQPIVHRRISMNFVWLGLAAGTGGIFVAVLGPGIHFSH